MVVMVVLPLGGHVTNIFLFLRRLDICKTILKSVGYFKRERRDILFAYSVFYGTLFYVSYIRYVGSPTPLADAVARALRSPSLLCTREPHAQLPAKQRRGNNINKYCTAASSRRPPSLLLLSHESPTRADTGERRKGGSKIVWSPTRE